MPINLKVTGHGLFALVASKDDKRLAAFLCEAPEVVRDQRTFVRFRLDNYSASNKRPAQSALFSQFGHVLLNRERISIVARATAADAELRIDRTDDPRSARPTGRDRKSFKWLPDADELAPGHGDLKAAYFHDFVNADPRLLARIDFTQGRLGTTGVENILVPFKTSKGVEEKRPMAREIVLELAIDADHFFLRSDPFEGARDPANDLRFEGDGDIEIVIGNESERDMNKETPPIDPIDVVNKAAAAEFVFYNKLREKEAPDPKLPHVAARPGLESYCSMKRYNSTDDVNKAVDSDAETLRGASTLRSAEPQGPKWSVFAFIAVDNNLRDFGVKDLEKIGKADPAQVNVVAQLDLPTGTTRHVLEANGLTQLDENEPLPNLDSGDPTVLTTFLDKCKSIRPAERTALLIASHGTGLRDFKHRPRGENVRHILDFPRGAWSRVSDRTRKIIARELSTGSDKKSVAFDHGGEDAAILFDVDDAAWSRLSDKTRAIVLQEMSVGQDDTARNSLNNEELEAGIRDALKREGPFGIIGFDACLMGMAEIAYQLRFCGSYFVASEDNVAPDGWPYTEMLNELTDKISPRDAAIAMVDVYAKAVTSKDATLSAVDLGAMVSLARALDNLGGALLGIMPQQIEAIIAAREATRFFPDFDYIDLRGFAENIQKSFGKDAAFSNVVDAATDATKALDAAVLNLNVDPKISGAGGLSVYIPNAPVVPEYHKLAISKDAPRWHDFVVAYGENF